MSGIKEFGFLYDKDKRLNAQSNAAAICYKAENPLVTDQFIMEMELDYEREQFNS